MATATKKTKAGAKVEKVFDALVADLLKVRQTRIDSEIVEKELLAKITAELPEHIDKLELPSGTIERVEVGGTSVTWNQAELREQLEQLGWDGVQVIDNCKIAPRPSDWKILGLEPNGKKVSVKKMEVRVSGAA